MQGSRQLNTCRYLGLFFTHPPLPHPLTNIGLFSISMGLLLSCFFILISFTFHIQTNICLWLISWSIIPSRSIHVITDEKVSFLCGCATYICNIHVKHITYVYYMSYITCVRYTCYILHMCNVLYNICLIFIYNLFKSSPEDFLNQF